MKAGLLKLLFIAFWLSANTMCLFSQESVIQKETLNNDTKCSLTVTPLNQDVTSSQGTVNFSVVTSREWTASSGQSWCVVTPSGMGNGTITATYQENTEPTPRIAIITVTPSGGSDRIVTVTQDEFITVSYSGLPWCPSDEIQNVSLSGPVGGTFSSQPAGLEIDPVTGAITPGASVSGSYTVRYTIEKSGGTRTIEASTGVAILPSVVPQIHIKWDDVLICSNVGNLFTAYQWFKGPEPITGATDQFYLSNKVPGVYTVMATDNNGCNALSNEISLGGKGSILVYPNPATSSFRISFNDVQTGKTRIRFINSSGVEVMNHMTEKSDLKFSEEITTARLDKGFYVIHVVVSDVYLYTGTIMVLK